MSAPLRVVKTSAPPSGLSRLADEWLSATKAAGSSPRTIDAYRFPVERIFLPYCAENGIESPEQITPDLLNRLNQRMLDGWSPSGKALSRSSVRSYLRQINVLLRWIKTEKQIGNGTTAKMPKRQKVIVVTLERAEITRLENAADSERDQLIVRVLGDTGIRLGELLKLGTADLIPSDRGSHLRIQGKGAKERLVPIQTPLAKRLKVYIEKRRPKEANTDRMFLTARRSRTTGEYVAISKRGVELMLKALGDQAGLGDKRVYPHVFRHSLATHLLRKGVSPIKVAELLGHASLAVLFDTYSHVVAQDARVDLDRYLQED
jgi:integrase/recombinase XerD